MSIDKVLKARAKTVDTSPEIKTSSGILKLLCGTAINNSNNKNPSANRYDKSLKLFCSSLFLLCGRLVYQTIQKILPNSIPLISTIQRSLRSNDRILEGEIRLPQLKDFLLERVYPLKVWISEDQTRINYIENEAKKLDIVVEGFSSDGDSRILKSMKMKSVMPCAKDDKLFECFQANYECNRPITIQDTIHISTKLRNRLLSPSIILPMRGYLVSVSYLRILMETVSKDKHLLTQTDINPLDQMNFKSIEKIVQKHVSDLLKQNVIDSDATVVYLKITRYILESFTDKNISAQKRIYKIWFSILFLKIWKYWLAQKDDYSTSENFITNNCYNCIELNAYGLILLIRKMKQEDNEDLFMPWFMNSQTREKLFRTLRLMTTAFSTVVNFTMLDVVRRLSRINFLNEATTDLSTYLPKCIEYLMVKKSFPDKRSVIYLQHGILASSADWVLPDPRKGFAYIPADFGHDVLMSNVRGTRYSRKHTYLDPERHSLQFWDFSWHEIGVIHIPTMIYYIINKTNENKLFYIRRSQ
ncbi:hypothetical protein ILUMI_05785 [Ignelater luminosus]|uniref:Uncharacterized protein n=1 Tax=Ignelater luminosus TaxID=2038154 RepID=A0A8K0GG17_IGNLU|nr:hypothetical protein ILUMI_05785 [Ignelater luminosus]